MFADITGELEDAAVMASVGQSVMTRDDARRRCEALLAAVMRMAVRLRRLRRSLA